MPLKKNKKISHYKKLKRDWLKRHDKARKLINAKHKHALKIVVDKFPAKEKLAHGAVGALMLSSVAAQSPAIIDSVSEKQDEQEVQEQEVDRTTEMLAEIGLVIPEAVRELKAEEEAKVGEILTKYFKAHVVAEIDGMKLNRSFGVIGAEQHLMRYAGDTMSTHLPPELQKNKMIYSSGMAPGRGAWGYFVSAGGQLTQKDVERERWYIAVQTFEVPDYNDRVAQYRDFFKFRKMLLVNTDTGKAIVTVIGDAGPAPWTGKHLGGSPEVMYEIGYGDKSRKGPVVYFFIDDPEDKIPLGPISAR